MKICSLNLAIALFVSLLILPLHGWSEVKKNSESEKVYVSPEDVEVTRDGILFYDDHKGEYVLHGELGYDAMGLYLKPIQSQRGPCGIHAKWCRFCDGCGVIYCPMKCECANGVGGRLPKARE